MKNSNITSTHLFKEGDNIWDMVAIDYSKYLLAAEKGLMRVTKNQLLKHYYQGENVGSLCHVTDSLYLLGFCNPGKLVVWNEQTGQQLIQICDDNVFSIKRVLNSNKFIINTARGKGVKVLTMNDFKSNQYSLKHLLDNNQYLVTYNDSLSLLASDSHIIIAATQNEGEVIRGKKKRSIQIMKKAITDFSDEGQQESLGERRDSAMTITCSLI